jgi:chromosome partitioning protein
VGNLLSSESDSVLLPAFLERLAILMPVIPFICPKGGTGKSTSALLLATFLTKFYDVTIIDADPNRAVSEWASGGNKPDRLTVVSDVDEDTIEERIEDAASKTQVVIVDLEGTASKIVLHAIAQADFVVIPMQGAHEDARAASRAVGVILETEMRRGSPTPYSVLFTRTNPTIRSRIFSHIHRSVVSAGVPVFKTELNERDAYKAMLVFQQTLDGLDPKEVPNLDKAHRNVAEFAEELLAKILAEQGAQQNEHSAARAAGG